MIMKRKVLFLTLSAMAVTLMIVAACSNSTDFPTVNPAVPESKSTITFRVLGDDADVVFTHQAHSEQYDSNCLECHSHADIRDSSIWTCDSTDCHSEEDSEAICEDDAYGHDCMYVQCLTCHEDPDVMALFSPPQAADCDECHMTFQTGVFHDAPVDGLIYKTLTSEDMTAGGGQFQYRPGETIEFFIDGISLGSGLAQANMTPLNLVPGASGVTDPAVTNIARFLLTMDINGDPSDGIFLPVVLHDLVSGFEIDFNQSIAAFETDPELLSLLDLLSNSGGTIFTDGPHSLVAATTAQNHLQNTLDTLFPGLSGVTISGAPNTHFILEAAHGTSGGPFTYQWYRADNAGGLNEAAITGATGNTYAPAGSDLGKYLSVVVIPQQLPVPLVSTRLGPATADTSVTVYSRIDGSTEVESYRFQVTGTANNDVIVDVESYESAYYGYHYHRYTDISGMGCWDPDETYGCHPAGAGASDLDLPDGINSNGTRNDRMTSNIYLLDSSDAMVDQRNCDTTACYGTAWACFPGCDAPDAFTDLRSPYNPYISNTLAAGEYVLKLGAGPLSLSEAQAGSNDSGGTYLSSGLYKITFTFN
jgi:hypothetical protein